MVLLEIEEFGDGFKVTIYRKMKEVVNEEKAEISEKPNLFHKNERSLKEVLKEVEYEKVLPIIELLDANGSVTPIEAKEACKRSETTTWRYLKILTNTGYIMGEGNTNNSVYKRVK